MTWSRVIRGRLREGFIVTTKGGHAFSGVLWDFDRTVLVLRSAKALGVTSDNTDVKLDGELILLLADVSHLQRP